MTLTWLVSEVNMNRIWIGNEQNMTWTWLEHRFFKNWFFYSSFSGTFDSKQWFPVNLTSIQNISRILAFKPTIFLPWRNPSLPKEKLSISFVVHSDWMRLGGVIKSQKKKFALFWIFKKNAFKSQRHICMVNYWFM